MCRIVLLICSFLWIFVNSSAYEREHLRPIPPIWEKWMGLDLYHSNIGDIYKIECTHGSFKCDNKCISNDDVCDGIDDCEDKSDEDDQICTSKFTCANDEFQCKSKKECIPEHKFCDGEFDCTDNSDEFFNCQTQLNCTNKFRCNNGFCVRKEWVCDGMADCNDNSDEMNCESKIPESECNNANNRYLCKNKRCISLHLVCNDVNDCGDVSDEGLKCSDKSLCTHTQCHQKCNKTPEGPVCSCQPGYKLQNNNITCTDIDECQIYGICDQGCQNHLGSYNCFCHQDYSLRNDNKTCKAKGGEATLLFSTRTNIRGYHLDSQMHFDIVTDLSNVVDIVENGDYLYWSEVRYKNSIIRRLNTRTYKRETIVTTGLNRLTSLAVDWITGNIYFTDSDHMQIGVCNDKGTYCTILINSDKKLYSLVLLPIKGLMYYIEEYYYSKSEIKMAGMDGKNMTMFIEIQTFVEGLAIDYPNNRLYWVSREGMVGSVKLDGTDERIRSTFATTHAISLAVFENKLYWGDFESKSIQSCDKFFGKNWTTLIHVNDIPYRMHIVHSAARYEVSNPCSSNPCSQLCLLNRNESYTCACSMEKELNADRHTCRDVKKKEHLIIIAGNTLLNYYHELLGKPKITTSTFSKHITEAVYDQLTGTILAIDQYMHYVIRYDPKNGDISNLISIKDMVVKGIAFDYIGNNVYLSNIKDKSIEVHSLTTREKTIFYFDEEPHSIETVPTAGIMYVIFKKDARSFQLQLDKINMNGLGGRTHMYFLHTFQSKLIMQYDLHQNILFINYIEAIMYKDNINFASVPDNSVSFAITEDNIFWTERYSEMLYWIDKNKIITSFFKYNTLNLSIDDVAIPFVIHLREIVIHKKEGCMQNNGNCSHVCLPSSLESFICACPPRMVLSANNRTCIVQTACPLHEIKCSEHDVCIKREQWCDGHEDCPNGEDEESNCKERGICKEDEFMCNDHTCIPAKMRCNHHAECFDSSDEKDCPKKKCEKGQYQCSEGKCISYWFVCDGNYDCPDYSDELHCDTHTCTSTEFMCEMGKCIPGDWRCDGEFDCPDHSDEAERCLSRHVCDLKDYECANGRCISTVLKCNGINDCGDESDEKYCTQIGHSHNCTKDEYSCMKSNICIPMKERCNGIQNCPKNDDEYHCTFCLEDEFTCNNQKCISKSWVCDNVDDCGDKSDETDCNSKKNIRDCEEFKCTNTCLSFNKVCDGIKDCSDGSDEHKNCSLACQSTKCKDLCHNTPHGGVCSCRAGYRLDSDGISCNDINECQQDVCSQTCVNTVGSFECSCRDGYSLRSDKISCKAIGPQMQFITATNEDIRIISSNLQSVELVYRLVGLDISGIDSNALDDAVYWSSEGEGTINKINIKTQEILTMGNLTPRAIAVDWITNNVYFYDDSRPNVIKVCNLEQVKCAVLIEIKSMAKKITTIVVDPINRYLFWSQTIWHEHVKPIAEIYRTDLMGTNLKKIIFWNMSVVSGMAIDYTRSKLYWSDSYLRTIESSSLDGNNRMTLLNTNKYQPININIFEDSIYWLMASNGYLQKCELYIGNNKCTMLDIGTHNIDKHFTIFHIAKHPIVENLCKKQHCDYMCILTSNGTACICQDGKSVKPDTICPKNANDEIIVASKTSSMKETHIRHGSGIYSTIIIVILIVGTLLGSYYFYQKYKFRLGALDSNSFDSIRFQNPSFDRRDEVAVTLNSTDSSNIGPGQHEYMNPVTDKLIEAAKECTIKRLKESSNQSEREDLGTEKDASLIQFGRS